MWKRNQVLPIFKYCPMGLIFMKVCQLSKILRRVKFRGRGNIKLISVCLELVFAFEWGIIRKVNLCSTCLFHYLQSRSTTHVYLCNLPCSHGRQGFTRKHRLVYQTSGAGGSLGVLLRGRGTSRMPVWSESLQSTGPPSYGNGPNAQKQTQAPSIHVSRRMEM